MSAHRGKRGKEDSIPKRRVPFVFCNICRRLRSVVVGQVVGDSVEECGKASGLGPEDHPFHFGLAERTCWDLCDGGSVLPSTGLRAVLESATFILLAPICGGTKVGKGELTKGVPR
jgi:hypothetical protein